MWKYCVVRVERPFYSGGSHVYDVKKQTCLCYELLYSAPEESEVFSQGESMIINGMDACEMWLEENADPKSTYVIQKLYFYEGKNQK